MTWAQKDLEICCLAFVSCFQALGPGAGECFQAHLPTGRGELGKKVGLTLTSHVAGQSQVQTLAQNNFVCLSLWFPCKHTHLLICSAPLQPPSKRIKSLSAPKVKALKDKRCPGRKYDVEPPPVVSRVNLTGICQTLNRNNIFFCSLNDMRNLLPGCGC